MGAYDRSLFVKPLGHAVQCLAIEELKKRGIRCHKIGVRLFHAEAPTSTDKEFSIGEFKQSFASHVFPPYGLTHKVENNEVN